MSDENEDDDKDDDFDEDDVLNEEENEEEEDEFEDEVIDIMQSEYMELKAAAKKLRALEDAGVENWEGYDVAMDILNNYVEDIDE